MARKFKLRGGSLDSTKMFVLGSVIVLLVVGYYLISSYNNTHYGPTKEAFTGGGGWGSCVDPLPAKGEITIAAFIAKWCPHCVDYHPTWNKIMKEGNANPVTVHGKKVRFVTVNCSKTCDYASKYGVEGFPTVKVMHNKTLHEDLPYESRDSLANVLAYLKKDKDV